MKTLLAFSGGLDSSYLLYKFLNETTDEITVFYQNNSKINTNLYTENQPEKSQMISAILDEYMKIRPFEYVEYFTKESELHPQLIHRNLLVIIQNYKKINSEIYDKLVFGSSYEDRHIKVVPHLEWTPTYYAEKKLFDHACKRGILSYPFCDGTWHARYTKAYAMVNLPKKLKDLTISCNNPKLDLTAPNKAKDCGVCKRCLLNQVYEEMLNKGKTPDEILQWRFLKNLEYGDNGLMAAPQFWIEAEIKNDNALKKKAKNNFRNSGHFNLKNLKNENLWKGLLYDIS